MIIGFLHIFLHALFMFRIRFNYKLISTLYLLVSLYFFLSRGFFRFGFDWFDQIFPVVHLTHPIVTDQGYQRVSTAFRVV